MEKPISSSNISDFVKSLFEYVKKSLSEKVPVCSYSFTDFEISSFRGYSPSIICQNIPLHYLTDDLNDAKTPPMFKKRTSLSSFNFKISFHGLIFNTIINVDVEKYVNEYDKYDESIDESQQTSPFYKIQLYLERALWEALLHIAPNEFLEEVCCGAHNAQIPGFIRYIADSEKAFEKSLIPKLFKMLNECGKLNDILEQCIMSQDNEMVAYILEMKNKVKEPEAEVAL